MVTLGGAPQSMVNTADTQSDLGIITRQTVMKLLVKSQIPRCQKQKTPRKSQAWLPEITQVMQHHPSTKKCHNSSYRPPNEPIQVLTAVKC